MIHIKILEESYVNGWRSLIESRSSDLSLDDGFFIHRMIAHPNYESLVNYLEFGDVFANRNNSLARYSWSHGPLSLIKLVKKDSMFELDHANRCLSARIILVKGSGRFILDNQDNHLLIQEGMSFDIERNREWRFQAESDSIFIWKGIVREEYLAHYLELFFLDSLPQTICKIKNFRRELKETLDINWALLD